MTKELRYLLTLQVALTYEDSCQNWLLDQNILNYLKKCIGVSSIPVSYYLVVNNIKMRLRISTFSMLNTWQYGLKVKLKSPHLVVGFFFSFFFLSVEIFLVVVMIYFSELGLIHIFWQFSALHHCLPFFWIKCKMILVSDPDKFR